MVDASDMWSDTLEDLRKLEEKADSFEQLARVAEIKALLSISQEVSKFNPSNTTSYDADGNTLNGWGMIVERKPSSGGYVHMS